MKRKTHYLRLLKKIKDKNGATAVIVAVMIVVLIGMTALAIDIGHLYVVDNELHNAADAGALAGAQVLYNNLGTSVNQNSNQVAYDVAIQNKSETIPVELNWSSGGNTGTDIERGHWSFTTRTFTPNDSLAPVDLWDVTTEELDLNTDFINAVRVRPRRESTPAASFFARIFGHQSFVRSSEAIAYIGFAGTLEPYDVDLPIAICKQAIRNENDEYTCGVGRAINSGANPGHETGGWSNYTQEPCVTASANTVKPLVSTGTCEGGNPRSIDFGKDMGTSGGEIQVAFDMLIDCWKSVGLGLDTNGDTWPDQPWTVTLPVIECPGNNVGPCSEMKGIVKVDIIWITRTDKNQYNEVPRWMNKGNDEYWECPPTVSGQDCWYGNGTQKGFVEEFNLKDVLNVSDAFYEDKTIYFKPHCEATIPEGGTGGENFGILAKIPVLVK